MNKRKAVFAVVCTVLSIAIVLALLLGWFFSPGMHTLWKFASFNFENRSCYIIDHETGEVVDRTELTLKGRYNGFSETYHFSSWVFEIQGYTGILPDDLLAAGVHDGEWGVTYLEYADDNGNVSPDDPLEFMASIEFVDSVPVVFIAYSEIIERRPVYAVCADSETEALQIYRQYLEKK